MAKFGYVAQDADGVVRKGVEDAETLVEARLALLDRQLQVTELAPKRSLLNVELSQSRIRRSDLMHLSRQLSAFLRAGIPILDAIAVLGDEASRAAVRRVMEQIGDDLRTGSTFSEAVDRHPADFPDFYRGILRSAELTGRLDTVLDQLAVYLERDLEARRKIKAALIYPAVVAIMAVGTVVVLSFFVLPKFENFFASLDAELPWPTRALLASTRFLGEWWWLISAGFAAVITAYLLVTRIRAGRLARDRVLLAIPVLGQAIRYAMIERFTRILASMVTAGVPLPEAMRVATDSLRNLVFDGALRRAANQMMEGGGLATPIAATGLFPGVATQMLRVGESTGTIDTQLEVAATFYERELDYKIKKLTTAFEPFVIVLMGLIVGFVAVALVSAMYDIFRAVEL
jgi:type IV pilus assembly protein PilC